MVRLYSNGTDLDLGEFATTLTFSIADIREPDKRNASFSKTLTLPGTKANNLFFENMFEVDVVTQTFNPNLKATTVLSVDGVTQFKGALKLRQVNYLLGGKVTYDCNLIGNLSDFIQTLGTSKLRDLDLSAYDHTYNQTNIEAAWTPTLGTGYTYPMVNYGEGSSLNQWDAGYFRPAPFVKTIWDAIFSEAGYSYSSTFLTSDLYKRLIVPNSNDHLRLTGTQVNERLFNAGRTTTQTLTDTTPFTTPFATYTSAQVNNDSSGQYFDNGGTFNTGTYSHEPTYTGTNTYIFKADYALSITISSGSYNGSYIGALQPIIYRDRGGLITALNSAVAYGGFTVAGAGTYTSSGTVYVSSENTQVLSGDKIYVTFAHTTYNVLNPVDVPTWAITNISFRDTVVNDVVTIGDTVVLSNSLPDMLQKDFVVGLIRMFNLYLEPDKDDETLLNIEPRDTYYNTNQVDWSAKLATEKDLEIEPMALLNFKRFICTYKKDDDYYNKLYNKEFGRVYGDYQADINNEFVTGDYKIETNFAATPLIGSYSNDRIIPEVYSASGNPPAIELTAGLPRILYWGGLKNCQTWTFSVNNFPYYKTQYPYAGHLDDPQAPTIDLSFGIPQKVYYGVNQYISSLTYTDNNLYNTYYSQMISEITDRDSKLVTGYFWLTPVDILNLDFRKIYRVGSHALRLNKIYDYNPVKSNLTKCEFIKIKDTSTFVSNSEIMNGGIDIVVNARENAPVIDMSTFQDGNVVARPSTTVITGEKNYAGGGLSTWIGGKNNRVHGRASSGVVITGEDNIVQDGASGVVIHGYNNTVGFGSKNLFIQGSRNTIAPNLENISLINSDGQTITESNVSYFNDAKFIRANNTGVIYSASLSIPTASVLTLFATPLDIVAAPGAGYAIQVVSASYKLTYNSIAYATNTRLQLITDTAIVAQTESVTTALAATVTQISDINLLNSPAVAETQIIENKSLKVQVASGNPTAGNSGIKVYVLYRIITL